MGAKQVKPSSPERVTRAEFAKRVKVSRSAVTQAIQGGRIKLEDDDTILLDQALKDWDDKADVGQQRKGTAEEDWRKARTRREIAKANLAELEYEEKLGTMVEIEKLKPPLLEMVTTTKERVLKLPRRVASMLEMKEKGEIEDILYHQLELALESLVTDA